MFKKPMLQLNLITSLPDDLVLSCLAHVSRLYYPTLSLVSKSVRSLLASPQLYQTRALLNRTESCLYVCLQFPPNPYPHWFTLYKKPNQTLTLTKEKSSGYVLVPIRIMNSPPVEWSNLVAVGPNLYAITEESPPCSNLSFLDCRTHTWLEAPSMRISHIDSEIDGNLYLPGSYENQDSSLNCIEVFNTKTQTWKPVPPAKRIFKPKNMEGKIYENLSSDEKIGWTIKPKGKLICEPVGMDRDWFSVCMREKIIYCCYKSSGEFKWFNLGSDVLRKLQGLEGLPKFAGSSNVKLVNYNGNVVMVLWDEDVPACEYNKEKEKTIWCAEISLEKRDNGKEIWGKVEWFDPVLTIS